MPHESSFGETRVLLSGLGMGESPRWHDGRLWFSDWGTNEVVAVDLEGNAEVMAEGGGGSGWAANWLPDGRMLITGAELMRMEPDGSRVRHAELSSVSPYGWSEMTIDGRGNVYVNTINFNFADFNDVIGSGKAPGRIDSTAGNATRSFARIFPAYIGRSTTSAPPSEARPVQSAA